MDLFLLWSVEEEEEDLGQQNRNNKNLKDGSFERSEIERLKGRRVGVGVGVGVCATHTPLGM